MPDYRTELIDISHTINEETPGYPGDIRSTLTKAKTFEQDCYTLYELNSGFHVGTHIDIPMHLIDDEKTVADFSPDSFIGQGVFLDVRNEKEIGMKTEYQSIEFKNKVVLLYTGYEDRYFTESYFTSHPTVSEELADFFIEAKVKMVGMDLPGPDRFPFLIHKKLLSNQIFILENLTNLHEVKGAGEFEVIALPLKIQAEASFVRAVCRI